MRKGCVVVLSGLMCAWLAASAGAQIIQEQREAGPTTPIQKSKDKDQESLETFKVAVNVANVLFNVKDKHGALLPNLTKDDFEVFEDGVPQKIKYFTAESNLPLTLGILVDTSPSQMQVLTMEQDAGAAFLKDVLTPRDLAFLMNFDFNVELDQDYTASISELRSALMKVKVNNGGYVSDTPGLGGGPIPTSRVRSTALFDAVYLAANEKLRAESGRKAMILLTDGQDEGSKVRLKEAMEAAQKADSIIYVILIADRIGYGGGFYHGDSDMKIFTEESGGRMIEVGNNFEKLRKAFQQIAEELRSQYSIGYTPTNSAHDGTYRKLEIKTKAGKVQARKGYYAARQ
jgi:VWFA-related protein